jgi:hypothetical protein
VPWPDPPWKGSRPRPAAAGSFPKPKAFLDQGRKYTVGFENAFTARGDPTSPARPRNRILHHGYVGQAARPPQSMALKRRLLAPGFWLLSFDSFPALDQRLVSQVRESLEQAVFVVWEVLGKDKHH